MSGQFDSKSGIRERLYLLSVRGRHEQYANWTYDPRRDTWSHVSGREIRVRAEGQASLDRIRLNYAMGRQAAMAFIGYPERGK